MKKKQICAALTCWLAVSSLTAQEGITQSGRHTGQPRFPLTTYRELDRKSETGDWWAKYDAPQTTWGSTDVRYDADKEPRTPIRKSLSLKGWRGERVYAQALVWSGKQQELQALNFSFTDFVGNRGAKIAPEAFTAHFVREVMTDELNKNGRGGCGDRHPAKFDSLMVADPIDVLLTSRRIAQGRVQPVWVQCYIPREVPAGVYRGELLVKDGEEVIGRLALAVDVVGRTLPEPSQWAFHLDLWQNPFAVARYYQLPLWSNEHFEAMRPLMKRLADAGQKVITASIMHKPWNGQTEDAFESMVTWMKRLDGTWSFDYAVFDRWVEFMMSVGIDRQISCYSMVPWELSFQYFDQATNSMRFIRTEPGEPEYEDMWGAMLTSFAKHLKEKGWFDRCVIAMDERSMDVMQKALKVIRKADPDFKVSLAGNYHAEIEQELYDYCIAIAQNFPEEVRVRRAAEHKPTTIYTCCAEAHPNTFTFSAPAEAAWIGFYSAKMKLDGYLRWAYNSWTLEPLLDSRFRTWAGGDTYLVYPGNRSSVRFERLIEGIQAHEKISILRKEFAKKGNRSGLKKIEQLLKPFELHNMPQIPAAATVNKANALLNSL